MSNLAIATIGGGCFWCIESAFNKVKGIKSAVSGFAGGSIKFPTYEQVISGATGHAEVVQITYNPDIIVFETILEMFFQLHDPTTLNRQGNDVGPQYRSIILYHNDFQKKASARLIEHLEREQIWSSPIVTELKQYDDFYPADEKHQGYADKNPHQPYCALLISPKLSLFKNKFSDWIKD